MKRKQLLKFIFFIILALVCITILAKLTLWYYHRYEARKIIQQQQQAIEDVLAQKKGEFNHIDDEDPFDTNGHISILLIGLDKRVGQTQGNCDAIQFIEIDKSTQHILITAVPRGTYSPLPFGVANTSTDFYVSNACRLAGLDYGLTQIENILGKKSDYLVFVGFSETLGILRTLRLPTTETLQWLRHRQSYAIGEPQRAHNHSSFLKHLITTFTPNDSSFLDETIHRIVYNMIRTDLSFAQVEAIIKSLTDMNIDAYPENIELAMRPYYAVTDIAYNPDTIRDYLTSVLHTLPYHLSKKDYSNMDIDEIQYQLLDQIETNKHDTAFITWAIDNNIWLQIEDNKTRQRIHYDILTRYLSTVINNEEKNKLLADYIIEMEYLQEDDYVVQAKILLLDIADKN